MAQDFGANSLLRALPLAEAQRLEQYFRFVTLTPGERLSTFDEPLDQLYFPISGAISRLAQLPSGETVEVGFFGSNGAVGVPLALGGSTAIWLNRVQIGGQALAISAADFLEYVREPGGPLLDALLVYANLQLQVVTQLTACHCLHRIEQRLSRCILALQDLNDAGGSMRVTHDTLAEFLGVHRPSVTYALQSLALSGVIGLERRRLAVRSRAGLAARACECYVTIRELSERELQRIGELNAG